MLIEILLCVLFLAAGGILAWRGWKLSVYRLDRPDYRLVLGVVFFLIGVIFGVVALTALLLKALT